MKQFATVLTVLSILTCSSALAHAPLKTPDPRDPLSTPDMTRCDVNNLQDFCGSCFPDVAHKGCMIIEGDPVNCDWNTALKAQVIGLPVDTTCGIQMGWTNDQGYADSTEVGQHCVSYTSTYQTKCPH